MTIAANDTANTFSMTYSSPKKEIYNLQIGPIMTESKPGPFEIEMEEMENLLDDGGGKYEAKASSTKECMTQVDHFHFTHIGKFFLPTHQFVKILQLFLFFEGLCLSSADITFPTGPSP
jgi:hypothetical protein